MLYSIIENENNYKVIYELSNFLIQSLKILFGGVAHYNIKFCKTTFIRNEGDAKAAN